MSQMISSGNGCDTLDQIDLACSQNPSITSVQIASTEV